jgi:hypothetical protein
MMLKRLFLREDFMCKIPKTTHLGYETLVKEVLPKLKNFKEDITKHDRVELQGYDGDFISMYRESGTHLFLCDSLEKSANWTCKDVIESIEATHQFLIAVLEINHGFLYIDKYGKSKEISANEAKGYILQRYERAMLFYNKSFKKMNFEGMAATIEFFMVQYGKRWKSNFIKEWESSYCSPGAQRIRNHFGMDFLKTIKFQEKQEEIRKSLVGYYMKGK